MSGAVVFVFLLGNMTDHNITLSEIFNATLHSQANATNIQQCDNINIEEILKALNKQLHIQLIPGWTWNTYGRSPDIFKQFPPEPQQNVGRELIFNSVVDSENYKDGSFDKEANMNEALIKYEDSDCAEESVTKEDEISKNVTKVKFSEDAPFLVAIFETLSNVTAQTCAGTLVSQRWVLTASSCVNLLGNLYGNDTNGTSHESIYTIVAGSKNPLSEGTIHNVTRILLHPGSNRSLTDSFHGHMTRTKDPSLALMRIEPEIPGETIRLLEGGVKHKEVMVYGWALSKNESGQDTLYYSTMAATLLSSAECKAMYSFSNNDVLCLIISEDEEEKNITLLSSGGPVLAIQHNEVKMLGVAQTDEHLFVAYSLSAHWKWLKKILSDK